MSDHLEHSRRWQHRTAARVTTHWSAKDPDRTHPGPVGKSCPLCHPKESTDEA